MLCWVGEWCRPLLRITLLGLVKEADESERAEVCAKRLNHSLQRTCAWWSVGVVCTVVRENSVRVALVSRNERRSAFDDIYGAHARECEMTAT